MVGFSCQSCGKSFEYPRSVLERYANPPKRCPDCRKAAKLREQSGSSSAQEPSNAATPGYAPKAGSRRAHLMPPPTPPRYPSTPTFNQTYNAPNAGGFLLSLFRKLLG